MPSISLSFDVDWAPDEVLQDTLSLLDSAQVKATFFATHRTQVLEKLDRDRYEIAVHPNFQPLLEGRGGTTFREVLREGVGMYDGIVGFRSHGVVSSGAVSQFAREEGLSYESNVYVPSPSAAFRDYDGLIRIPIYWSDYREVLVGTPFDAEALALPEGPTLTFAFHPVHVFVNLENPRRYVETKHLSPAEKVQHRHVGAPKGIRDFLVELLERTKRENIETLTMREIVERHTALHGDAIACHLLRT